MTKRSKLYRSQLEYFDRTTTYSLDESVEILQKMPHAKFDETVELALRLGIDPRQSDQAVRGAMSLPHGTGKQVRVVVFATGDAAEAAREAGADEVGFEEHMERVQGGWLDFDTAIATPAAMQQVRRLGRVLGPRGLMPNPKTGTVTDDPAAAVQTAKAGRVEYRADRGGCCHVPVGKVSFAPDALKDNIRAVLDVVMRAKPPAAKGTYLLSCTLSSTMGPGVKLDARQFQRS
jgi:large subunit ribosomal protein L1